jgi:hypothetical protein
VTNWEPGISVSIVSHYGLDDRSIGVRSPAGAKDFSSNLCVQTGSEAHPASCAMGTGGVLSPGQRGRDVTLTTHPHLVPRSRMSRSYTSSPPSATMACSGTPYKWRINNSFSVCEMNFSYKQRFVSYRTKNVSHQLVPWVSHGSSSLNSAACFIFLLALFFFDFLLCICSA